VICEESGKIILACENKRVVDKHKDKWLQSFVSSGANYIKNPFKLASKLFSVVFQYFYNFTRKLFSENFLVGNIPNFEQPFGIGALMRSKYFLVRDNSTILRAHLQPRTEFREVSTSGKTIIRSPKQ
jgi:hypothetical protein